MQKPENKTIFILLTEYSDRLSRFFQLFTAKKFTHASIGIESKKFFSFVTKGGFRVEKPWIFAKLRKKAESCALYRLDVTDETYDVIQARLQDFNNDRKHYRYSFLGALLCFLRIPHHFKKRYFCSQFVAELLSESGALELKKPASLYHPNDFEKESQLSLCFHGSLIELAHVV